MTRINRDHAPQFWQSPDERFAQRLDALAAWFTVLGVAALIHFVPVIGR